MGETTSRSSFTRDIRVVCRMMRSAHHQGGMSVDGFIAGLIVLIPWGFVIAALVVEVVSLRLPKSWIRAR